MGMLSSQHDYASPRHNNRTVPQMDIEDTAMFGLGQGSLYKQVYADETLTEAWRKVRLGTDLAGVDGVTVHC